MSWKHRSFEVLPALSVRRKALRQSLRLVTVAWMFGIVWMACVTGAQMTMFCRLMGFEYWGFGILAAIPYAACFFQLLSAVAVERTGVRKYQFIYFATVHRLLWIVLALVGLALPPGGPTMFIFLCVFAGASILGHLSSPPWQTWMGDLIPRRIRGRYFANRAVWTIPIQVVVAVSSGWLLDKATLPEPVESPPVAAARQAAPVEAPPTAEVQLPVGAPGSVRGDQHVTREHQPYLPWAIAGLFALGGVFGTIDILLFLKMREIASPPLVQQQPARRPLANVLGTLGECGQVVVGAFKDRVFRHYALYSATLAFSMGLGGQWFWLYTLEDLKYTKLGANFAFLVLSSFSSFNVIRLWGKLTDRWGRRPILMLSTCGIVFSTAGWFFIPAGSVAWGYALGFATCAFGGTMWSGVNLAQSNIVMGFSESKGRSRHIAAAQVVAATGGALGGLAGAWLAYTFRWLQDSPIAAGPFRWNNYHVIFLAVSLLRAASVLWLIGMPEPGSRPFRDVARDVAFNVYSNVFDLFAAPLRVFRRRDEDQP